MSITWILVADGSRARLLESQRSGEPLHPLGDFANPTARRSTTGRPRSHHESVGCGRSVSQSHRPPDEDRAARFAHALTEILERGRKAHRFDRLILVAPARLLGTLRDCCGKPLRARIAGQLGRDLVALRATDLHERIAHLLEPPAPQSASSGISDRADRTPLRTHPVTAPMTEPDRTPRSAGATMNRGTDTRSHHVD